MSRRVIARLGPVTLSLAALLIVGCDDKQAKKSDTGATRDEQAKTGATSSASAVAPEIANAVQAAALQAQQAAPSTGEAAPPPDGILGLERANAEVALGSAPKLSLATAGSEPRVQLGGPLAEKQPGRVEIAIRTGPQAAMPTTAFELVVGTGKLKGEDPESLADTERVFDVKAAGLGGQQPGTVPEQAKAAISKLKGSEIVFPTREGVPVGSPRVERAKGSAQDLDLMVTATADALQSMQIVYPQQPVGKGAMWMVTSREVFMGTDVVSYRLYKVAEADASGAVLEVNTKRYAAASRLHMPGLEDNTIVQFQGTDEGQLRAVPGQQLPVEGRLMQRLGAVVQAPGDPDRAAPVQFEVRTLFSFPAKAGANGTAATAPGGGASGTAPAKPVTPAAP